MSRKHMIEAEAAGVQDTPARREVGRDGRDENLNAEFFSVLVANGLNWQNQLNRQMTEVGGQRSEVRASNIKPTAASGTEL